MTMPQGEEVQWYVLAAYDCIEWLTAQGFLSFVPTGSVGTDPGKVLAPDGERGLAAAYATGWRPEPDWLLRTVWQFMNEGMASLDLDFDPDQAPPPLEGKERERMTALVARYIAQINTGGK
jgi:hypothetical protein